MQSASLDGLTVQLGRIHHLELAFESEDKAKEFADAGLLEEGNSFLEITLNEEGQITSFYPATREPRMAGPELPMQPIVRDALGVVRFRQNRIVRHLLDLCGEKGLCDLNLIGVMAGQGHFSVDEQVQFAQLIGSSLSLLSEQSYVSDRVIDAAEAEAKRLFGET